MEDDQKRQRLLPRRQDSAQDEGSPAPRLGSITGRNAWKPQATQSHSSTPLEAPSLWQRHRGGLSQDADRQLTSASASTSGRPASPAPDFSPARLNTAWQSLRGGAKTSWQSMAKENLPKDSATIPWREVPDLDDSPQRSPDSKSALRAMALPNENIQVHFTSTQSSPKPESGLLSRPELEEMICWETNNLYEYLKDLYDQEHADLADYNSEQLKERLSKYHVMLEDQQGKNYKLTDQLALKEDQISQLQRALDVRKAEMQGLTEKRPEDSGYHFIFMPSHLFPAYPSYRWGAVVADSWRRYPKMWLMAFLAAVGILLTIILCATLVGNHRPSFTAGPQVTRTAGFGFDTSLSVDHSGFVYYTVIPSQSFLSDFHPGDIHAGDVVLTCFETLKTSQLQSLSVACGQIHVPRANSLVTLSVASTADENSTECQQAAQDGADPGLYCQRCPSLQSATDYVVLLVAVSDAHRHRKSGLQLLPVTTADVTPPTFLTSATASNVYESNFTLTVSMNEPGRVFYGIYYASFYAQYLQLLAAYTLEQPTPQDILGGSASSFSGALAASGFVEVLQANTATSDFIQPPCSGAICAQSIFALAPNTAYQVWLVAVDGVGNAQATPTLVNLRTAPDTTPPVPLVGTGPSSVSTSSFAATFSLDTAGAVYYVIANSTATAADVAPGSVVGPLGAGPVPVPAIHLDPSYVSETLTIRGQSDTVTVNIPNTTTSTSERHLLAVPDPEQLDSSNSLGFTPWDGDAGFPSAEAQFHRTLQDDTATSGTVGTACDVLPTCVAVNVSCKLSPTSAILAAGGSVQRSISLGAIPNPGCLLMPNAGTNVSLSGIAGLANDSLYQLTFVTEDTLFGGPNRSPAISYLIRTVDRSIPHFTGLYARNITATAFELAMQMNKPGTVFYLVTNQSDPGPSVDQVVAGQAYSANNTLVTPVAAHTIDLPYAFTDANESVSDVDMASAYNVYFVGQDNNTNPSPNRMTSVTELNVTTPSSVPPAFTVTAVSNFTEGTAILTVATNETAEVFYLVMLGQNTAVPSVGQVSNATTPDNSSVIDSGSFVVQGPRVNTTDVLHNLVDLTYYTVWLAAEDMQTPPLQQSIASKVIWQQPYLMPPQMNATIKAGSIQGDRFSFNVSMNVSGKAHYVLVAASPSLPTTVDSQALTSQNASALLNGASIIASGETGVANPFTNYSQAVLGLQSAVNYSLYIAGRDLQPQANYATPATLLNVTTADVVPPSFTASTPNVTSVDETNFTLVVQLNKSSCTAFFSVLLATSPQPSLANVLAGTAPATVYNGTIFTSTAFTNSNSLVGGLTNQGLYTVWLVAKDSLGNTQTALSSVNVKTVRTTPPSFEELIVQYNPPTSVYIEVIMDEPCAVHFVGILRSRDVPGPSVVEIYNFTGRGGLLPDFNGTINVTQAGIPFSSGACGILPNTIYNVYLVAQDFISPPNLQAVYQLLALDTSNTASSFTCAAGIFSSHLKPDIVPVGSSPGLPTSQLYGNVSGTTRFYRNFAAFNSRTPGTAGSLQALVNGTLINTSNSFAYTTQTLPPASVIATVRNLNIFLEDLVSPAADLQEGQLLSIAYQVRDAYGHAQVNTANLAVVPHITYNTVLLPGQSADVDLPPCDASALSAINGTGNCNILVPESYFPAAGQTAVAQLVLKILASGVLLATSSPFTLISLVARPTHTQLANVGMLLTVPYRYLHPGETFTVQITANSPTAPVASWFLPLYYDPSVIAYTGNVVNTALWATPYLNLQSSVLTGPSSTKTFQYLSFNCPGRLSGTGNTAAATASSIPLMSVTFTVLSPLAGGPTYSQVLFAGAHPSYSNANNLVLTSDASAGINIAKQVVAQVYDMRTGNQTEAQLYVPAPVTQGLWAYADSSELFNTLPVTGDCSGTCGISALLQAFLIRNWHLDSQDGTVVTSGLSCGAPVANLYDVSGGGVSGCTVAVNRAYTGSSAAAQFTMTVGSKTATVPLRIWVAQNLQVSVDDPMLNLIIPADRRPSSGSSCSTPYYQRSSIQALCDFVSGSDAILGVDVTTLVSFTTAPPFNSAASTVATVINNYVQGVSAGIATVSVYQAQAGTLSASTSVSVVDTFTCLTKISVVAYTGAAWLSPPASISPQASITAPLLALQDFSFENSTASVRAYASYSDGFANDVTDLPGLNITSLAASYITVKHTIGNITAAVTTSYGGSSYCGNGLNASLSVCSVPIGTGSGPVNVSLPSPIGATLTATPLTISQSGDPATFPPINMPVASTLSVQMLFSDGSVRDFSSDSRVLIVLAATSRTYCQLSTSAGQPVTVSATSATFTTSQTCALTVSFPGFSSPVPTATAQVTVVVMKSLVIRPQHYNHTFAEGDLRTVAPVPDSRYTTLQQIKCNGSDYEQATLWMLLTLTNTSVYDVTTVSSITLASSASSAAPSPAGAAPSPASATSAPAKLIANLGNVTLLNRLRPQLPGTAILTGSFGGKPVTSTLSITLGGPSTAVTVASVELSATWCTSGSSDIQCSVTFAGLPGATNVLEAQIIMSDQYIYTKVLGSVRQPLDILYIPGIFSFSSTSVSSITVQTYGDVTLLANANAAITLTMAVAGCPGQSIPAPATTSVYANLNPPELDVDVGQAYGLQVQSQSPLAAIPEPLQVGQTFSMEVRVNSTSSPLIAYQLRLNYDSAALSVASESSCQSGADWPASSLTFVCNARGSASSVFFNSILRPPFASQQGGAVRVATITFTARRAQMGAVFSVDILGLAQNNGNLKSSSPAVAAAGSVTVIAATTGRRHLLRKDYGLHTGSLPAATAVAIPHSQTQNRQPSHSSSLASDQASLVSTHKATWHPADGQLPDIWLSAGQKADMERAWFADVSSVRHRQLQQASCTSAVYGDINCDNQFTFVKDVLLLDSLRGSWDSSNPALYYSYLAKNSTPLGTYTVPSSHQKQELDIAWKYYSALPHPGNPDWMARKDLTTPTNLAAVVGPSYQAQPGSSEDKALYQLISAGLQWFLDGVYISTPTTSTPSLSINVKLVDTANTPLATGSYTQVQVELQSNTALTFPSSTTNSRTSSGTYLATATFTSGGNFLVVTQPVVNSGNNCGAFTSPQLQLAVLVAAVDYNGVVQNQSFYPYYGSTQKLVYQPNALSSNVYSSQFVPYTSFNLADTYAPAFQAGYPTATNIIDTGFTLTAAFYESATVHYIVMTAAAVAALTTFPPSVADVQAEGGTLTSVIAAHGSFLTSSRATGSAPVTRLTSASNYTAFLVAVDSSNNVQPGVSVLRGIITPDTLAPTFTFLNFTAPIIDQNTGLFSMNITLTTSLPALVYYAMYRDYSHATIGACVISPDPSRTDIASGAALPTPSICTCAGTGQCAPVTYASLTTDSGGMGSAALQGTLSALPFAGLTNQTCFNPSNLGTATDTYRVFVVAQDVGITYNGLATRCTPVSRLAADPAGCPTTAFIDCNQAQSRSNGPNYQSGNYVNWTLSNGTVAPPAGTDQHPLQFSVNLANQALPSFYNNVPPLFTPVPGSVQISFALTAPGLVIYSIYNVTGATPVDSGRGPGSLYVGNGRIPVTMGGPSNVGYLTMTGCNALNQSVPLAPSSQYLVQYWIRDKFATRDTVVQAALATTGA